MGISIDYGRQLNLSTYIVETQDVESSDPLK